MFTILASNCMLVWHLLTNLLISAKLNFLNKGYETKKKEHVWRTETTRQRSVKRSLVSKNNSFSSCCHNTCVRVQIEEEEEEEEEEEQVQYFFLSNLFYFPKVVRK